MVLTGYSGVKSLQRRDLGLYPLRILLVLCSSRCLLSSSQLLSLKPFCDLEGVANLHRGLVQLQL